MYITDEQQKLRRNATSALSYDEGGCHVLWYCDDDKNSGYGEQAEEARWYGNHDACMERMSQSPPAENGAWAAVEHRAKGEP